MLSFSRKGTLNVFLALVVIKLTLSPWSVGVWKGDVGLTINYICDGSILALALMNLNVIPRQYSIILMFMIISGITYALSTIIYTAQVFLAFASLHLKVYLPIIVFIIISNLVVENDEYFLKRLRLLCIYLTFLMILGIFLLPSSDNRGEQWLASYFGGLHSTSYVATMVAIVVLLLGKVGLVGVRISYIWFSFLACLVFFGWGVRTATLVLIVYLLATYVHKLRVEGKYIYPVLLPVLVCIVAISSLLVAPEDVDAVSSGRISMYLEKYYQLSNNTFLQWIVGNGSGSDLIVTDVWWWAAKGAHSDVLTFLVEGGVVYLSAFLLTIFVLLANGPSPSFKFLLLACFTSGMFSNGIFVRPSAGYMLAFALVAISMEYKNSVDRY